MVFLARNRILKGCMATLLLGAAACSTFPPPKASQGLLPLPERYSLYPESSPAEESRWWISFNSDELNALMDEALQENLTLQEAWARLKQSTALHQTKKAGLFPSLSTEAGADTTRRGGDDTVNSTTDSLYLGLAASYEVDLWGRIRALSQAESQRVLAVRANVETAAMTLSGQVAEAWTNLVSTRGEIAVLKSQMALNSTLLNALELRFENSMVSAVDVLRQRKVIEQQASELPSLLELESRYQNALALLLGKAPGMAPEVITRKLPAPGEIPPTGLPADLLAMRPDIRSAGLTLRAEEWEISAARADRLPALSITARARFGSDGVESLFDNWFTNLAANLTGPIFDAGRRKAEVFRARAQAEERLATYRKTVLTALSEVENALVSEVRQKESVAAMEQELITSRLTLTETENRYTQGVSDYVTLLAELKDLQTLERKLVKEKAQLVKNRIALHRALGGNWTRSITDSPSARITME
ncbi:efflux transporter outer membrane subunit [Desulfoluna sp.]|uniref:efflux transporter outer membrane subunit n=1 Tax=Desulfoluna sp. TaxID=2045199 RepID=UPI0026117994|nr:efflux transporter outer membrane subunit [Desulfoluna sp.]